MGSLPRLTGTIRVHERLLGAHLGVLGLMRVAWLWRGRSFGAFDCKQQLGLSDHLEGSWPLY